MFKHLLVILSILFVDLHTVVASESGARSKSISADALDVWHQSKDGFFNQAPSTDNIFYWIGGSLMIFYSFAFDNKVSGKVRKRDYSDKYTKAISGSSIAFNFPIVPFAAYYVGKNNSDQKMVDFSKEYLASLAVVLIETNLISAIPIHTRPMPENATFWEKNFRYESSFPSGHVAGYSVLAMNLENHYGFKRAILPYVLALITSYERVVSSKHYLSDVTATWFLSLMATRSIYQVSKNIRQQKTTKYDIGVMKNGDKLGVNFKMVW